MGRTRIGESLVRRNVSKHEGREDVIIYGRGHGRVGRADVQIQDALSPSFSLSFPQQTRVHFGDDDDDDDDDQRCKSRISAAEAAAVHISLTPHVCYRVRNQYYPHVRSILMTSCVRPRVKNSK